MAIKQGSGGARGSDFASLSAKQNSSPRLRILFFSVVAAAFFSFALPEGRCFALSEYYASRGKASWYGTTAHGKQTANGEIYSRYALSAAHKSLPFGTVVRVYNLRNGRHALVRVNDRGPFVKGRVIDVSFRAANALKMTRTGVVPVALEIVGNTKGEPLNRKNAFYVLVGNEATLQKARKFSAKLENRLEQPLRAFFSMQEKRPAYALCIGPYYTFDKAMQVFLKLEEKKIVARGIIEAPAKGGNIPRHTAPGAVVAHKKPETGLDNLKTFQSAWNQTVQKGELFFDIIKNTLPGMKKGDEVFHLLSFVVPGYSNASL